MKKKILLFFCLIISFNTFAKQTLTVYTYDSFVSEWGPGPQIKENFETLCNCELNFVAVDSAASMLSKIILEGKNTKADILLGIDMNLIEQAKKTNLFDKHPFENLNEILFMPIKWQDDIFVPFDYGYFAFVYNHNKITNPPKSMEELINRNDISIVIQDPRTSTVGLGLLTWIKSLYGNQSSKTWNKLSKKIVTVTKGWSDAYYNIFLSGEADMVLSYTTSPAAHIMFENDSSFKADSFKEGNYITIEVAAKLKNSQHIELANMFLEFMLTDDFQSSIPSTNIMYPVINLKDGLPDSFSELSIPSKVLQINPTIIMNKRDEWTQEWLNNYKK